MGHRLEQTHGDKEIREIAAIPRRVAKANLLLPFLPEIPQIGFVQDTRHVSPGLARKNFPIQGVHRMHDARVKTLFAKRARKNRDGLAELLQQRGFRPLVELARREVRPPENARRGKGGGESRGHGVRIPGEPGQAFRERGFFRENFFHVPAGEHVEKKYQYIGFVSAQTKKIPPGLRGFQPVGYDWPGSVIGPVHAESRVDAQKESSCRQGQRQFFALPEMENNRDYEDKAGKNGGVDKKPGNVPQVAGLFKKSPVDRAVVAGKQG